MVSDPTAGTLVRTLTGFRPVPPPSAYDALIYAVHLLKWGNGFDVVSPCGRLVVELLADEEVPGIHLMIDDQHESQNKLAVVWEDNTLHIMHYEPGPWFDTLEDWYDRIHATQSV